MLFEMPVHPWRAAAQWQFLDFFNPVLADCHTDDSRIYNAKPEPNRATRENEAFAIAGLFQVHVREDT